VPDKRLTIADEKLAELNKSVHNPEAVVARLEKFECGQAEIKECRHNATSVSYSTRSKHRTILLGIRVYARVYFQVL